MSRYSFLFLVAKRPLRTFKYMICPIIIMSVESFILMNVETGKIKQVIDSIKKLKEVKSIASTAGKYDLILKVEVTDLGALHDFVTGTLQNMSNIKSTETQIIAKKIER